MSLISILISCSALIVSILTAWFTLMKRGTISSTRPAVIYIGVDGANGKTNGRPKIHFRSLLYCSAKRGLAIDNLSASLMRGDTVQHFTIWVYGEKDLSRGSGLFVPDVGVVCNHHFLMSNDDKSFCIYCRILQINRNRRAKQYKQTKRIILSRIVDHRRPG